MMTLFSVLNCSAEIIQIKDIKQVFNGLQEADQKTLVIFDVDMVLIQPSDPAYQMANIKRYGSIAKKVMNQIPPEKQMVFLSLMTVASKSILIDERLPCFLQELTQRGIPTIALTANLTGKLGSIQNMEKWRVEDLKRLGIDFSPSAPCHSPILFDQLPAYRGSYSSYLDGVLFVNGTVISKGDLLLSYLSQTGLTPNKVVFVDDREDNLKSLDLAIQKLSYPIEYVGFHYLGAMEYPSQVIDEGQFSSAWENLASQAILERGSE